jgi:hypothetical protein
LLQLAVGWLQKANKAAEALAAKRNDMHVSTLQDTHEVAPEL